MSLERLRLQTAIQRARLLTEYEKAQSGEELLAELIWRLKADASYASTSEESLEMEELHAYLRSLFDFTLKGNFSVAQAAAYLEVSPKRVLEDLESGHLIGKPVGDSWELPADQFDERCISG